MATKTVVCPECGEAAAPGRYACADCGALLAAVGTFARRWDESERPPSSSAEPAEPQLTVPPILGLLEPKPDDGPALEVSAAPIASEQPDEPSPATEAVEPAPATAAVEPAPASEPADPIAAEPLVAEPPAGQPLATEPAAPEPVAADEPDDVDEEPTLIPDDLEPPVPQWPSRVAPRSGAAGVAATNAPAETTPAPQWPPAGVADPAPRPAPRTPAGAYLSPSPVAVAAAMPARPTPLAAAARPAAAVAVVGVAAPPADEHTTLGDTLDAFGITTDFPRRLIGAGAAVSALGFLLPWASAVIGGELGGAYWSRWGLAGGGHWIVVAGLIGLVVLALAADRFRAAPIGAIAIVVAGLVIGLLWPYVFGVRDTSVGIWTVLAGAVVLGIGGILDLRRHDSEEPGV
jgi:hypothetical protein